jgi:hypothetical protein
MNNSEKFIRAMQAFAIANFFIWLGNIFRTIYIGEPLLPPLLIDLDLGILFLAVNLAQVIYRGDYIMIGFAVIGWFIASIYVKKTSVRQEFSGIMVLSAILPSLLSTIIILIVTVNITLGLIVFIGIYIILAIIIIAVFVNFIPLIIAVPGILFAGLFSPAEKVEPIHQIIPNYLVLFGYIPPTPNEPVFHCPFRMKSKPGCAFLGYKAPEKPLICDYQSTWISCYVYSHIYQTLEEKDT